ncbi:MAG: DNA-directed RNA polymerase subunit beta [Thermoguttaceae bacterium]|jgi:DNA-directed RNA polymerase subunit beta
MAVTTQRRLSLSEVRRFGKNAATYDVPNLTIIQTQSYKNFLQADVPPEERENIGLEALLRESFPIVDPQSSSRLEYVSYVLEKPRYLPDECRRLRITYGHPWRVKFRLVTEKGAQEDEVYLGELPIMLGGGEFIINGAERVVVNQLHRSPGADFLHEINRDSHSFSCRIIPERGSWVEFNITRKEILQVRIDQSNKFSVMTLLRAMDPKLSTDADLMRAFDFDVYDIKIKGPASIPELAGKVAVGDIVDPDAEVPDPIVRSGSVITNDHAEQICELVEAGKNPKPRFSSVTVMAKPRNMLLANSLGDDKTSSHEQALLAIYKRLRPGNPLALQKAQELFHEKFFDPSRYRIGRVGRFRMNRKFNTDVSLDETALRGEDVVACVNYLYSLWSGDPNCYPDDIDHLGNRRIRTIDELICEDLRNKGFLKLRRNILDRFHQGDSPRALINQKNISTAIEYFFGRNELSQVVDQTNPLSMLTHERRLSALGPGGLNRKRAGFEVRDVHATHYGRICPIETPEGQNIGLISYLSIFAQIDDFGFLTSPYRRVENGVLSEEIEWLRADDEIDKIFAPADTPRTESTADQPYGALIPDPNTDLILARKDGEYVQVRLEEVNYIDVAPNQMIGVSAGLIPFLEHDDANRALMGSNMQRQAVPLLQSEAPIVGTGMEVPAALNSSLLLRAHRAGTVTYMDSMKIVIDDVDVYHLRKFAGLNGSSCENQRPIVEIGEHVEEGQVIADGACTDQGVLALGRNVLVGFMVWDGYNYEDAIILSEELVQKDVYTSIHIEEYDTEIRDTKTGRESFTRDVPNASEKALSKLDENGIIRVGTYVSRNDILVGKVVPKQKVELSPEEKLLQAIFGKSSEEVKNESLVVPAGVEGVVIGAYHFRSLASLSEEERTTFNGELARIENEGNAKIREEFASMISDMELLIGDQFEMKDDKGDPLVQSRDDRYIAEQAKNYSFAGMCSSNNIEKGTELYDSLREIYVSRRAAFEDAIDDRDRKYNKAREGDQLKRGVLQMVKVYIATKRAISVGDKMAGRHGNKGVIARILPREDMPFLADGTPLQILLNPLGVPSRMNVGQILETHLGWAASTLGYRAITPVFDGATEEDVNEELERAGLPRNGKVQLYDGRTGEPFAQETTVGYIYMLKLHHLVDDKVHARSTGPYSLITQQPLGGKARSGGQRYGEMEVWALEAYGAAYTLQELLTVKSDDIDGRTKIYERIVGGTNTLEAGTPASFDVLVNEVKGLALDMDLVPANVDDLEIKPFT